MKLDTAHDPQEVVAVVRYQDQLLLEELDKQLRILQPTPLTVSDVVGEEALLARQLDETG